MPVQQGWGGVFFTPQTTGYTSHLWRQRFPPHITTNLISASNPTGTLTNSDLELAATVAHHDVICQHTDIRERTIYTLTNNTPAAAWQSKGSTTTTGAAAYLLRQQALHQRHHRYCLKTSHIRGTANTMADDCSRLWDLDDTQLLSHFAATYPQTSSWQLCHLPHNTVSSLTSALQKERPVPGSWLHITDNRIVPGAFGSTFAESSAKTLNCKTSQTQSLCCKSLQEESGMEDAPQAVNPSSLLLWTVPSWQSARRSPCWGPRLRV